MKIDRDILLLEKAIGKSDYSLARKIIELNEEKFKRPYIRSKLSMEALTLLNCVHDLNDESNKELYSRETQLIIRHINKLAYDCRFSEIKRFTFLQKDLLSNPKIYGALSSDAKALIAPPDSQVEADYTVMN
ncbi:hypothetical protein SAMN05880501_11027 [Ureibacillus xyleni]|uniref:Uncharacterized protein n=1 Tax=Ureibacillus xyleni TaxID=614648 RepID=A0A285T980_9BACL|nr:hypothetical protein [Ureibacillus xyleni]SOC18057.1 hypothetical protein SAMN05880501_11027 [Ureibacillus xyleni]